MTAEWALSLTEGSRFGQRVRRRYADDLALLSPGLPTQATMRQAFETLQARTHDVGAALRMVRQLVLERLMELYCTTQASQASPTMLANVTQAVSRQAGA